MPNKRARVDDSRDHRDAKRQETIIPVDVKNVVPPFVQYSPSNPPRPSPGAPLTLAEITHVFLYLAGQEECTYEGVSAQVAQDIKHGTAEEDGMNMFLTLIEMPPEDLFISLDSLDDAADICKIKNINVNNMVKYADKYGDKDGYCGYCDFLNITKHAKLW